MPTLKICSEDRTVRMIREIFQANIVRIPKERIQPLSVIGSLNGRLTWLGHLDQLTSEPKEQVVEVHYEDLPRLSSTKTSAMEMSTGLSILDGFCSSFGIPSAKLEASIDKDSTLQLSFEQVRGAYIEPLQLGDAIRNRAVKKDNPFLEDYLKDPKRNQLLLVTYAIQSNNFVLESSKKFDSQGNAQIDNLENLIDIEDTKLVLNKETKKSLKVEGGAFKTFAFRCVQLTLDPETGKIQRAIPTKDDKVFKESRKEEEGVIIQLDIQEAQMFDI